MMPSDIKTVDRNDVIILNRGDYTYCTVNLLGATITSWKIKNQEMIFVSRQSHFTGLSHIRGGIQFVFPVLGSWSCGPSNGFARNLPWDIEEGPKRLETGDIYARFSLSDNPYTHSVWNHKFKLYYKITLGENYILFHMGVENIGNSPIDFILMQHFLMRVSDITKCEIKGLKGYMYKDLLRNNQMFREQRENVTISELTNKIYFTSSNDILVKNTVKRGTLKISRKFARDILLWNPWIEQSLKIHDLGDDEYQYFVGVEGGAVREKIRLEPWSCWAAIQRFEFVEPKEKQKKIVADFYDLFDGYC